MDNKEITNLKRLLDDCNAMEKEIEASKEGIDFLINEYKTNKRYFRDEPGNVTIEDVIKTCFEFGWASKRNYDYNKDNKE